MTFGKIGEHRNYRSGGTHYRKNGEIFCDTFQGKLAEFFFFDLLTKLEVNCPKPETERWHKGKWDDQDFIINNKVISIKSMASFSNLLLLETKDWDLEGIYIPNQKKYDLFVVVRIKPDVKSVFKSKRILYSNILDKKDIEDTIKEIKFEADIPGFVTHRQLVWAIKEKHILPQGAMLNGRKKMDAENYYILSIDFEKNKNLKQILK
ncbi:hypothetical protein N9S02_01305 [Alphaproteobacteria bacterium]|nr:hypothetical protein [Alphaproteobacteria bacterium]